MPTFRQSSPSPDFFLLFMGETHSLIFSTYMTFIGSRKEAGRRFLERVHLRSDSGCFFHSHIPMDEISGTGAELECKRWSKSFNAYLTYLGIFSLSCERVLLVRTDGCRGGHTSTAIQGCPRSEKAEEGGLIRPNYIPPLTTQQQWLKCKKQRASNKNKTKINNEVEPA